MQLSKPRSLKQAIYSYFWILVGALLAAVSIQVFLYPNQLIDGGVIGISLILARIFGDQFLSIFMIVLNLPFIYLSYKHIRKTFVIQMGIAVLFFAFFLWLFEGYKPFLGEPLEIIVFGGALLGLGVGLIIRNGGCTDGTEILGIIINRRFGFTVGQVVLFINFFVFAAYGAIFVDWHIALKSLMTYFVAFKMIDLVIVGFDELKSVTIITQKTKQVTKAVTEEMGLGLTVMYGRGGYSGDDREILMVIVERLDLSELKELVLHVDPEAFLAIQDLHEIVTGRNPKKVKKRKGRASIS
ncbi:MAG: YitT family protein [Rhabdochlamydiaceae bacterium]|nr:YitT family protein [Candidatus Amphrikana amoebophyrae]